MQKLNITKEEFLLILNNIRTQKRKNEKLNDALDDMCDGYVIFNSNDKYLESLLMALNRIFYQPDDDIHNTIDWYLYGNDSNYDNSHIMTVDGYDVDINTDELLYELLAVEFEAYANGNNEPLTRFFRERGTPTKVEKTAHTIVSMTPNEVMDMVKERYIEKLNRGEIV